MPPALRPTAHEHYEVLSLTHNPLSAPLSNRAIKDAYHQALLLHHPDKAAGLGQQPDSGLRPSQDRFSVDEIVAAYQTLSDPAKRAAYDQRLCAARRSGPSAASIVEATHPGVEAYDLADLTYDEKHDLWRRECRCGNEQGYLVTEGELEKEAQHGEIYVGCKGCSLFIKVTFEVAEDEDDVVLREGQPWAV